MPDTGAPWNIPYVESTDLVSGWPSDSLALANAIADGLDAAGNAGIGSNVVQTVKTDTFSTSSTSFTDVTGLSVTITPSTATSKILLVAEVAWTASGAAGASANIIISGGNTSVFVGDAAGSRTQSLMQMAGDGSSGRVLAGNSILAFPIIYLDSPATAGAVTYTVQMKTDGNTGYVNRGSTDADSSDIGRTASSLIAIEVAA